MSNVTNEAESRRVVKINKTEISSVDKGNSWTGSVTSGSGKVIVTVNSLIGLFSRSDSLIKKKV